MVDVRYNGFLMYPVLVEIARCEHALKFSVAKRLYKKLGEALQQADSADAHRRCPACGGIIGSYSPTCNSGNHTRTA